MACALLCLRIAPVKVRMNDYTLKQVKHTTDCIVIVVKNYMYVLEAKHNMSARVIFALKVPFTVYHYLAKNGSSTKTGGRPISIMYVY